MWYCIITLMFLPISIIMLLYVCILLTEKFRNDFETAFNVIQTVDPSITDDTDLADWNVSVRFESKLCVD